MRNFYYFVTGLKELPLVDEKLSFDYSVLELINDICEEIPLKYRKPINEFLFRFDNENLCNVLEKKDLPFNKLGVLPSAELLELINLYNDLSEYAINFFVPEFWNEFILNFIQGSRKHKDFLLTDELNLYYYEYLKNSNSKFLREYSEYDFNLKNLATAVNAKKFKLDKQNLILPVNEFSNRLISDSSYENIVKEEFNILTDELSMMEKLNVLDLELRLDYKRLDYIESLLVYEYFSVDKILGYLVKLSIVQRWSKIDKVKGTQIFNSITNSIKESSQNSEK